jgi:hypothetical protein
MIRVEFIDSPTEQTTAATDVILAGMALVAAGYLILIGQAQPGKASLWAWAFTFLATGALLGAVAHGLKMSEATRRKIWHPLFLALGLTVALFVVGPIYDLWGPAAAWVALPVSIVVAVGFFVATLVWPHNFIVFVIYEAVAMLFALAGYLWLAFDGRLPGAWLMVTGILVTIVAAAVQASGSVSFTLIWKFDHNGAYHLIQLVGIVLLVAGLRAALLS